VKNNPHRVRYLAAAISLAMFQLASAQQAADAKSDEPLNLDAVVVTGTSQAGSKMKQSVSISTIGADQIEKSGATSSAELLRSIPGVRSESSGGEGNANITMRGVPISAGGARYTQFQENGLPILLLGDFNFVTSDMFSRADYSIDRVEVVRGGSGSTQSSNSPAGIINFVKKTGEQKGGSIGLSAGLGYNSNRMDFEYGAPISSDTRFYIGGYYRRGEGARKTAGVTMENGGQISGNLTQNLGGGSFIRVDAKLLDDKTPTLLPTPIYYDAANKSIVEIPGINPRTTTPYSNGLQSIPNWGVKDGGTYSINDGLQAKSNSIGGELNYVLGGGFVINDKLKISSNSGKFSGLLANGANTLDLATNQTAGINQLFLGAKFNNLGLTVNDLKGTKTFTLASDSKLALSGGLFYAKQRLDIDWEIGGFSTTYANNNAVQTSPYTSFFKHAIDVSYTQVAPYISATYDVGALTIDGSLRQDRQTAKGTFIGSRYSSYNAR
jgi:outer membrane receptor protein involved in Fe transport